MELFNKADKIQPLAKRDEGYKLEGMLVSMDTNAAILNEENGDQVNDRLVACAYTPA